jgi:hypothetical protein
MVEKPMDEKTKIMEEKSGTKDRQTDPVGGSKEDDLYEDFRKLGASVFTVAAACVVAFMVFDTLYDEAIERGVEVSLENIDRDSLRIDGSLLEAAIWKSSRVDVVDAVVGPVVTTHRKNIAAACFQVSTIHGRKHRPYVILMNDDEDIVEEILDPVRDNPESALVAGMKQRCISFDNPTRES